MKRMLLVLVATVFATPTFSDQFTEDALKAVGNAEFPVVIAARDGTGSLDFANLIGHNQAGRETLVDTGSITKTVTAVAILHLIEAESLTTDATLAELLPDVPEDKEDITLHQLLTHTSGLVAYTGDDYEDLSRDRFLARIMDAPLGSTPGQTYEYSNPGYSDLAAIIELRSGLSYEDYVIDRVLAPLSLPPIGYARVYDETLSLRTDRQFSTWFARLPVAEASWGGTLNPGWNMMGNGGAVTTPEAFLQFWFAFFDGQIVGQDLVDVALFPHVDMDPNESPGEIFYGYGLIVSPQENGTTIYWHDGGNSYFSAVWMFMPALGASFFTSSTGEAAVDAIEFIYEGTN